MNIKELKQILDNYTDDGEVVIRLVIENIDLTFNITDFKSYPSGALVLVPDGINCDICNDNLVSKK